MSSDYCDSCECAIVDGACNCTGYEMRPHTDRRANLSTWGSLAIAAAILLTTLPTQAATFTPAPGQGAPQQATGAGSR
jgi:hypothetical protein